MKTAPSSVAEAHQMIAQCQQFMLNSYPERDKIWIYKGKIEFIIEYTEKHLGEKITVKYLIRLRPIIDELNEQRASSEKRKQEVKARRRIAEYNTLHSQWRRLRNYWRVLGWVIAREMGCLKPRKGGKG